MIIAVCEEVHIYSPLKGQDINVTELQNVELQSVEAWISYKESLMVGQVAIFILLSYIDAHSSSFKKKGHH